MKWFAAILLVVLGLILANALLGEPGGGGRAEVLENPVAGEPGLPDAVVGTPDLPMPGSRAAEQGAATQSQIGSPITKSIPASHSLPEMESGMTTGEFLEAYWGGRWPEVEAVLLEAGHAANLSNVVRTDAEPYRPVGTIEDFFDGLEERAIGVYEKTTRRVLYYVPKAPEASYLQPNAIAPLVVASSYYNPTNKVLDGNAMASLKGLIEEGAYLPTLAASDLDERWRAILKQAILAIVAYEPTPIGSYSLAPILNTSALLPALVDEPGHYPVIQFNLPYVDALEHPTSGGCFSGILRVWAGHDAILISHYDRLHLLNEQFRASIKEFIASLV